MRGTISLALLGLAIMGGAAQAQAVALPTAPPASQSNPIQDGAYVALGPTESGNLGLAAHGGRQTPVPVQATVSGDGAKPASGTEAYVRVPKDGAVPQGADVRLTLPGADGKPVYQGVQVGRQ